jgi:hypothetical protein
VPLQPLEHLSFAISGAKVTHFIDVCNTLRRKMQVKGCYVYPLLIYKLSRNHQQAMSLASSFTLKPAGSNHDI